MAGTEYEKFITENGIVREFRQIQQLIPTEFERIRNELRALLERIRDREIELSKFPKPEILTYVSKAEIDRLFTTLQFDESRRIFCVLLLQNISYSYTLNELPEE